VGWALSHYSGAAAHDTRVGDLVHNAKYGYAPLRVRKRDAEEVAHRMMSFIGDYYGDKGLPFEMCIAPPSHQKKPFELAWHLCSAISTGFGLKNASSHLHEVRDVPSLKTISDGAGRRTILSGAFRFDRSSFPKAPMGFLIVDDVFHTGATAETICTVLEQEFPESECHLLTATARL